MRVPRFTSSLVASGMTVGIAVVLCYFFVDRPLSIFLESLQLSYAPRLRFFEHFPVAVVHLACLQLVAYPFISDAARRSPWVRAGLRIAVSVAVAAFVKDMFKGYFGRYWTRTWICDNPSLIGTQSYGFNWWHSGSAFGSFPSGHACIISVTVTALALSFPGRRGLRALCIVCAACTCSAVLAQNFHFLGDIFAGVWLGTVIALCVHRYWPHA